MLKLVYCDIPTHDPQNHGPSKDAILRGYRPFDQLEKDNQLRDSTMPDNRSEEQQRPAAEVVVLLEADI